MHTSIAFIGGGNMASALIGGLLRSGQPAASILVVEPFEGQRAKLAQLFGIAPQAAADTRLAGAATVVWAVKPQLFGQAAEACAPFVATALQVSVMAGIRSDAIANASGSQAVVRAMPNTPAMIGRGIAGLYARPEVTQDQRDVVQALLQPTGTLLWLPREADLDAVTALSGSGPAYVFFVLEAMIQAAVEMGLTAEQGKQLALATFDGAAALAAASSETPGSLREQVTSKGGTTHAAISSLQVDGVGSAIVKAVRAAQARAAELGDQFG